MTVRMSPSMKATAAVFAFTSLTAATSSSAAPPSQASAGASPAPPVTECTGCRHDAADVEVVDVQSTYYTREHINKKFSGKLLACYNRAGWHAGEEHTLDYLVAYDAASGKVTSIKGSMFGKQANADLLHCIDHELTGVDIGQVRKDPEVHGFAMTVRVHPK